MPHTITLENYPEAEAAIRDILFMYRDLLRSDVLFFHGTDVGRFDPFKFVDAVIHEELESASALEIALFHEGALVALLCGMSDFWDELGTEIENQSEWGKELRLLLDEGRLDHLPLAKTAIATGIESEEELRISLPEVYNEYVVGYFRRLIHEGS